MTPADVPVTARRVERRFGPYGGRYVPETLVPTAGRASNSTAPTT